MENNLTFLRTWTVEQFKQKVGVSDIDIVKNPKTGKLFMSWGPNDDQRGAVKATGIPTKPVVSEVTDGVETFYLLHEKATTNIVGTL